MANISLTLPTDMCAIENHIRMFEQVVSDLAESKKLAILFQAVSESPLYNKFQPFFPTSPINYTNLKQAIIQACDAFEPIDHKFLYAPNVPDPLRAYRVATKLVPDANDITILEMIKSHLKPEIYLQIKFVTSPTDKPIDGKLLNRLIACQNVMKSDQPNDDVTKIKYELELMKKQFAINQTNHLNAIHTVRNLKTEIVDGECGYHREFAERSHSCVPECDYFDPAEYTQLLPNGAFRRTRFRSQLEPYDQAVDDPPQHEQHVPQSELTVLQQQIAQMSERLAMISDKVESENVDGRWRLLLPVA